MKALLDLLFPPMCRLCREETRHLLCPLCQEYLAPIDPSSRCRHCFSPVSDETRVCRQCAHHTRLGAIRGYLFEKGPVIYRLKSLLVQEAQEPLLQMAASLFVIQWERLGWDEVHRAAILPERKSRRALSEILEQIAEMMGWKISSEFRLKWQAPFTWSAKRWQNDSLEGQTILLLDWASSTDVLRSCLSELWPAFPKKVYIFSLFDEEQDS